MLTETIDSYRRKMADTQKDFRHLTYRMQDIIYDKQSLKKSK